nr:5'-nucleotidase C-terminal domain-containing protein [uncultured Holophaga sp.]
MFRWLFILIFSFGLSAEELRLQVVCTSGVGGQLAAQDTYSLQSAPMGWVRLASLIRGLRSTLPSTTLVLDGGAAFAGSPSAYVRKVVRPDLPEPSLAIMNAVGCGAMALGEPSFAYGLPYLRSLEDQAQFPFLAANLLMPDGSPAFMPYAKLELQGVSVAVVGLATSFRNPLDAEVSLRLADPVETLKALVPRLRQKEKADLVVLLLQGDQPLKESVPGVDLVVQPYGVSPSPGDVPVLQPRPLGRELGVAEWTMHREWGRWKPKTLQTRMVQVQPDTPADPQAGELSAAIQGATDAYLDTPAARLDVDLDGRWGRMEDGPLLQLLHTVVRKATRAQITAVPSPRPGLFIPKGPTSVRQFYALAPSESRLARIRVTGAQLRAYLEQAATYYNFCHLPDLISHQLRPEDFDVLDGVAYALDISKPMGSRVVALNYEGQPVKDTQEFTLGLSECRLQGAGGYLAAAGLSTRPEWLSRSSFRNLILAQVLEQGPLNPIPTGQWRIIPSLDRERVMEQEH